MTGPDIGNHYMCIYIRDLEASIVSCVFINNQKNLCARIIKSEIKCIMPFLLNFLLRFKFRRMQSSAGIGRIYQ
jgi:hypothetical protein